MYANARGMFRRNPPRPVRAAAGFLMRGPMFAPQHGSAIIETESQLTPRQSERILAELQAIGFAAVILPPGVTVATVAECRIQDDDE